MRIDELTTEDFLRLKEGIFVEFSNMQARELAYYFTVGTFDGKAYLMTQEIEDKRILIREYLQTQSEKYRAEFEQHLQDPLLGQGDEDDFLF